MTSKNIVHINIAYLKKILKEVEALNSGLKSFISWQRFAGQSENRVETKTLRGSYYIGDLLYRRHENEIYQMAQEELSRQMACQILRAADWYEIESMDGDIVYAEVDVVVKPNRHTLRGDEE